MGLGRLVGPVRYSGVHTSAIGLVPKSGGRWRMIVDHSAPPVHSVNSGIPVGPSSLSYSSVDDAVRLILQVGRSAELVKIDLKDAYRMFPIHPEDQNLLVILWRDQVFVDRALPFGLRSAPKIFSAVADAAAWVLHGSGVYLQVHYLDDFLFVASPRVGVLLSFTQY